MNNNNNYYELLYLNGLKNLDTKEKYLKNSLNLTKYYDANNCTIS